MKIANNKAIKRIRWKALPVALWLRKSGFSLWLFAGKGKKAVASIRFR